jgi:hypothetical protein
MAESDDLYNLVVDIDEKLGRILQALTQQQRGGAPDGPMVADDRDLDGKYGNPNVKFNPRDWHGESMKGRSMSECPAEFLDLLAESFEWFARRDEKEGKTTQSGKPLAPYQRKDAARCRGWAARIRNGYRVDTGTGEITEPSSFEDGSEWPPAAELTDADIPF